MTKETSELEQKRIELETIYNPPPPMRLIYQILIGGTIGVFLAVVTVRHFYPDKLPKIIINYPQHKQ